MKWPDDFPDEEQRGQTKTVKVRLQDVKRKSEAGGTGATGPQVSARGNRMPASPIRKLMPVAEEAKRQGVRVLHLNIGQPDLETPAAMRERLTRLPDKVIAYTPSGGTPEYLAFLSEYYRRLGLSLSAEELIQGMPLARVPLVSVHELVAALRAGPQRARPTSPRAARRSSTRQPKTSHSPSCRRRRPGRRRWWRRRGG